MKIGLGTGTHNIMHNLTDVMTMYIHVDVSGGYSPSVFSAMRTAIDASRALGFNKGEGYKTLTHHEALYMATLGGAKGK